MAPPNSFLHVENFTSLKHLAEYILYLDKNEDMYKFYHEWRKLYEIIPGKPFLFNLCLRLTNNISYPDKSKSYTDLSSWWSSERLCRSHRALENITNN